MTRGNLNGDEGSIIAWECRFEYGRGGVSFCLYESFLFLTLLDVVAAGTGAALLAMPVGDELD